VGPAFNRAMEALATTPAGGTTRKNYRGDTDRVVTPRQTLERVRPFLARMGITRVANVTGLDFIGIPVVMVCRPNSRALAVSQGKGLTLDAARCSGVMESVESYHAERIDLPLVLSSQRELSATRPVVEVARLNRPRESAFHPDLQMLWLEAQDLERREPVWVPYEMVHSNFTPPRPPGAGSFAFTSNGLASGNHFLEAVSHGICEAVERDSTTLWSLAGKEYQARTRIVLDTVDDPGCREVLDRLKQAGMSTAVWETTTDVGIPCFMCVFADLSRSSLGEVQDYIGYGCHPSRRIALLRALTEAVQMRLTVISGARDDLEQSNYRPKTPGRQIEWMAPSAERRPFHEGPDRNDETFDAEVSWQMERLAAVGLDQVLVVDLSRPEFGLPVVRVIVPGLEMAFMDLKFFALGERGQRLRGQR
jgi:YcaO-like protein with predicted kinase domain